MAEYFLPAEARPAVLQDFVREAWAVAAILEVRIARAGRRPGRAQLDESQCEATGDASGAGLP